MNIANRLNALYDEYSHQYGLMIAGIVPATAGGLTSTFGIFLLGRASAPQTAPLMET